MGMKETLLEIIREARNRFSAYNLLSEQLLHLPINRPIYIFALGKAAYQMTEAVLSHAANEEYIRIMGGLVLTRYGNVVRPLAGMKMMEAAYLIPDENSLNAGEAAIEFLHKLEKNDILLVLLSGGGSGIMEKPVEGISLDDYNRRMEELYANGAGIEELDAARKQMSALKGGKLLQYVKSKDVYIYAMSDIPGDIPKYICSNPFFPEAEETGNEMGVEYYHRFDNLTQESFIPKDKAIVYKIIGNNRAFCDAVRDTAIDLLSSLEADLIHIISAELTGESLQKGREIANLARVIEKHEGRGIAAFATPCLLIFGGETYVKPKGSGVGGRSTELALAAVEGISGLLNCSLLAYITDGKENFCNAAGAFVDIKSKGALMAKGIDINKCLQNNDSFTALQAIDAIIPNEKTGINVNDVVLLYIQ